jgi:apolipoprotein N-acyltransferase
VSRVGRLGLAATGAVAVWASFPPGQLWWLAPVGVMGLALSVAGAGKRMAAAAGLLHGAVFFVLLLSFVRVFGIDAWLGLAAGESMFFLLLGLLLRWAMVLRWAPVAVGAAWVAEEAARDRLPFGGFPWGRLADAQAGGPIAHLAALGGAPLVSFAVATIGGALAVAVLRRSHGTEAGRKRMRLGAPTVGWCGGAVALGCLGLAVPLPTGGTVAGGPASLRVAIIQGNVPRLGLDAFAQRYAVTRNQAHETDLLARAVAAGGAPRPQVVVWPENSADNDPFADPTTHAIIARAVARIGVPILVGAVLNGPTASTLRNAAIVWSPGTGPGAMYFKRHLVPFGEYLPFRAELSQWIGRFSLLPKDFLAGTKPGVLQLGPARIADALCFEIADDGVVRQAVTGGGRLIVNQTNDASYEHAGDTGQGGESAQQLQISRLRAIEHGRSVVVSSTSGLSAVINPDGTVEQRSSIFVPAVLQANVPLRDPLTLADRLGVWPEVALCLLAAVATARGGWLVRRRRRAGRADTTGADRSPAELAPDAPRDRSVIETSGIR